MSTKSEVTRADWLGIILGAVGTLVGAFGTLLGGASLLVDLASHRVDKETARIERESQLTDYLASTWQYLLPEGEIESISVDSFTKDPQRLAEARRSLEQAKHRDDGPRVAAYEVLVLYAEGEAKGSYEECIDQAEALLSGGVEASPVVRMYLAYALQRVGKADEAVEQARQATIEDPRNATLHLALGTIYHRRIMDEEAIAAYQAAIEALPGGALAYDNLGIVYAELDRPDEAITEFRKALRRDDKDFLIARHLGSALYHQEIFEEASLAFRHALALNPEDEVSAAGLGDVGRRLGTVEAGPLTDEELGRLKRAF